MFDLLGLKHEGDLAPGEAMIVTPQGKITRQKLGEDKQALCLFEFVYFARPDSMIDDISVYKSRIRMGKLLAEKWQKSGKQADVIIPIPDSARTAAYAMALELDIPYREGFIKNRYVGRTFIMPNQKVRSLSVRRKLNPMPLEFEGKDVLLVDDSIVRGTTSKIIIQMAREAGARSVSFASMAPPLRHPCVYGVDMATTRHFIATDREVEDIAQALGADYLIYQDLEDLREAVMAGNRDLAGTCSACFSGQYPTGDITKEMFEALAEDRVNSL